MMDLGKLETLALWREMNTGEPAALTIPALIAVRDAYQGEDYEPAATMAAMQEANRQGPGLWHAIVHAAVDAVAEADREDLAELRRTEARVAKMTSDRLAAQILGRARKKYAEGSMTRALSIITPEPAAA